MVDEQQEKYTKKIKNKNLEKKKLKQKRILRKWEKEKFNYGSY